MANSRRWIFVFAAALCAPSITYAQNSEAVIPLKGWIVPPFSKPADDIRPLTHTVGNTPAVFVPMDPCRLHDTRLSSGGAGPIGGSGTGGTRDFDFVPSGCPGADVPGSIIAWSLNFTVVGPLGSGFLYAYPTGGTPPPVAIINYNSGDLRNNAAIVPVNAATGSFTVGTGVNGTDVIIDANGIFLATLETATQFSIVASIGGQGAIAGTNSSTTAASSGVHGLASATTGAVFGVFGKSSSTGSDSAGVKGADGTGTLSGANSFAPAGVRGESTSAYGILGLSRFVGVRGDVLNVSGASLAEGRLGYSVSGTNYGLYAVGDVGATGTKSFVLPHPTDPSLVIRYISLEGPEAGTYFRGRGRLEGRSAVIDVPESFRLVTEAEGLSVQLTPIGGYATLWVTEPTLEQIVVRGSRDIEFFYTVNGIRRDYGEFQSITQSGDFMPESSTARLRNSLSDEAKRNLITNGTYNPDGSVNLETARRLRWTETWQGLEGAPPE